MLLWNRYIARWKLPKTLDSMLPCQSTSEACQIMFTKNISLITFRDSEGLLERNTEAVLKAARLGDVPMLTQLHNEVRVNLNPSPGNARNQGPRDPVLTYFLIL